MINSISSDPQGMNASVVLSGDFDKLMGEAYSALIAIANRQCELQFGKCLHELPESEQLINIAAVFIAQIIRFGTERGMENLAGTGMILTAAAAADVKDR